MPKYTQILPRLSNNATNEQVLEYKGAREGRKAGLLNRDRIPRSNAPKYVEAFYKYYDSAQAEAPECVREYKRGRQAGLAAASKNPPRKLDFSKGRRSPSYQAGYERAFKEKLEERNLVGPISELIANGNALPVVHPPIFASQPIVDLSIASIPSTPLRDDCDRTETEVTDLTGPHL